MKNLFITGGTGFVGKAVLARLLDSSEFDRIYLLVRPGRETSADARLHDLVGRIFPKSRVAEVLTKVQAVAGDLTESGLGLSAADRRELVANIHQILHVGASTDFGSPIEESRKYNVTGTYRVLELAMECKRAGVFSRFDYVSTAFVAGLGDGEVMETDLVRGQRFANPYEQSKCEAETLVRDYMKNLDIVVHRPSIIVGDSISGFTPHFKVLYWPLRVMSKNLIPFVACNLAARLDVVPVDFVANGIIAIMLSDDAVGKTFHLTSGKGGEVNIRTLLQDATRYASIKPKPTIPMWVFNTLRHTPLRRLFSDEFWQAVLIAEPYMAYLRGHSPRFNAKFSHEFLAARGIHPPKWDSYKKEVLSFCRLSHWGRRMPMAEYIYYLPAVKDNGPNGLPVQA